MLGSHVGGQGKINALWGQHPAPPGQVTDAGEQPSPKVVMAVGTGTDFLTGRGRRREAGMNVCHRAALSMALSLLYLLP